MAGDWPVQRLPDLLTLRRGHDLASDKRVDGAFPVIAATGQVGIHNEPKCDSPGVVIGRSGSIGGAQWIDQPFWPLNTTLYVVDFKGNNPYFCYSVLKSIDFQRFNAGSGVPTLNRNHLVDIEVPAISRNEQDNIANLLFTLDAKFDLNRQMVATLEEMARALFKSWFVDFDPVRAKVEGRDTGLPADITALFPDSFDIDALPLGWQRKSVLDLAHWVNGAAYKNMHFSASNEGFPVVKIAELKSGVTKQTKFTNTDLGERYKISDGELLFSWSGSPETSIDSFVWMSGEAWLNQHIFAVRENGEAPKAVLHAMLKYLKPRFVSIARDKQTTGLGHVTKEDMSNMLIGLPQKDALFNLSQRFEPIFDRIINMLAQQDILEELRGTLLPKLLSGELRVADTEAVIAAA